MKSRREANACEFTVIYFKITLYNLIGKITGQITQIMSSRVLVGADISYLWSPQKPDLAGGRGLVLKLAQDRLGTVRRGN